MSHGFERRRGLGRILLLSVVLGTGCIHRQTDLEWARSSGSSIDTSGSTIRGKSLEELEVMVEPHGVRRWRPPMEPELVAGSPYGMRTHPIKGGRRMHKGQDIPCKRFAPIYAVARGEVVVSKRSKSAGKYIEIRHESKTGKDVRTTYMHMSIRRIWREGRTVRKGKKIGRCGSTGSSTAPHLHFEVKVDGSQVAPFSYVERSAKRD
jgi:murein DD-endopeptidase MepM/ murein hydrolase activator NlpD